MIEFELGEFEMKIKPTNLRIIDQSLRVLRVSISRFSTVWYPGYTWKWYMHQNDILLRVDKVPTTSHFTSSSVLWHNVWDGGCRRLHDFPIFLFNGNHWIYVKMIFIKMISCYAWIRCRRRVTVRRRRWRYRRNVLMAECFDVAESECSYECCDIISEMVAVVESSYGGKDVMHSLRLFDTLDPVCIDCTEFSWLIVALI